MNKGQKILKSAKKIIPGGNQLLSKRSEMFAPNVWPAYFSKAKGCEIWDLENRKYFDFAGMGVTACLLGYADNFVNKKVKATIDKASLTTLNSIDEIQLAKKLLKIHNWAEMAKFSKSGGEACLVAIRLARAYSKKQNIAFCGYHGWHDWYLAANLNNKKNLDNQLLPGLSTLGVSKSYSNSLFPFLYNDIESLKKILIKKNNIGIIIMEPMNFIEPKNNFLKKVKALAKKNNIILIFDEITTGFKDNLGGLHLKLNVTPDIAIFGKSLANGFPISAVIGKKKIMSLSNKSFISSTMWTEQIGFVAANATIEKLEKNKIKIKIGGIDSLPKFKFDYKNEEAITTFMTKKMLNYNFLASTYPAATASHNDRILDKYARALNNVFFEISKYVNFNKKIPLKKKDIKGSKFGRLTG